MSREELIAEVNAAAEVLRTGGLILYPTDTVWGIGCDATNAKAIDKIVALKQRCDKKSMIVLTDSIDRAATYTMGAPDVAWELMEVTNKPLTVILPKGVGVAPNLLPEEGSIAIRVVEHDFCRALCRKLSRPLVSTSANVSGEATPVNFEQISDVIKNGVDMVISPKFEGKPTRKPSAIIKLGVSGQIEIVRE